MQEYLMSKKLSLTESAVVIWMSKGMTNKEIANTLGVKDKTIKFHLTNVYKKMGVKNRTQLLVSLIPQIKTEVTNETITGETLS